ncbi:unnamed protein product, partial [marine sediment metagenome]
MKIYLILLAISIISSSVLFVTPILAQEDSKIPDWVKEIATLWVQGNISDDEFLASLEFLIGEDLIQINSNDYSETETQTGTVYSDKCPIDTFLDVSNFEGAGSSYSEPFLNVYCDDEFVYVQSNGIPHYTFVQTTPNALSEQDYLWKIPINPETASQSSKIPLLGLAGFSVNG